MGHPDDLSSYYYLAVDSSTYDKNTGKFTCGSDEKTVEDIMAQLPSGMTCADCTLQWTYEAPGYGTIYQCSDISIMNESQVESCQKE